MIQEPTPRTERAALLRAFADGVRPQAVVSAAEWGRDNFVVPVGPQKGEKLDLSLTPYVVEPLEMLRIDSPWTRVSVKKSAQTGFSTISLVWLFSLIATAPDEMMMVQPSLAAAKDFNEERLDKAIKATRPVARRVRPQRARSGEGSTTLSKKFPGGRLILTGANSSTDLSAKTVRFAVADEIDRWPLDLDGQGDPMAMLDARQTAFTRTGSNKKLEISTPTNKGSSRIDKAFAAGDQRKWFMPCPHCGDEIAFEFENLRGNDEAPFQTAYWCQGCGAKIESWQQRAMVLAGKWRPTRPGPGRHPSYFINALSSLLTSWDVLWKEYLESRGDPLKEKGFVNLWLGESFEDQGSDVDATKIVEHAEDFARGLVPANVGRTVLVVDTQGDRLEWALWGFGPPATSVAVEQWLIDAGVIDGDMATDAPWLALDALAARKWPYQGGREYAADLFGIDTGGHSTQDVYKFVRHKPKWRALKGANTRDALILSTPRRMEVKNQFGRLLFRVPLYFVGGFDLKLWLSAALKAIEEGRTLPGGLRLPRDIVDEGYAEQLTAEVLVGHEQRNGMLKREWKKIRKRNEALDLAVYARALAFGPYPNGLGVDRIHRQAWSETLAERHAPPTVQADLFAPRAAPAPATPAQAAPAPTLAPIAAPPNPALLPPIKPRRTLAALAALSHG